MPSLVSKTDDAHYCLRCRSFDNARGPFAEQSLHCVTPTADDLKAELLAHGRKPPSSGPPRNACSAERAASAGAELAITFTGAKILTQQAAHFPVVFPQSSSCPPEFWGKPSGLHCSALSCCKLNKGCLHGRSKFTSNLGICCGVHSPKEIDCKNKDS